MIDNSISVKIEIFESTLELFVSQRLTKFLWKLFQFISINGAISILVELIKSFFDSLIKDFDFAIMQSIEMSNDSICTIFDVCKFVSFEDAWIATKQSLIAFFLQVIFDLVEIILILRVSNVGNIGLHWL